MTAEQVSTRPARADRVESVRFFAACDCCDGDAEWDGTVAESGGGTSYTVRCLTAETASTIASDLEIDNDRVALNTEDPPARSALAFIAADLLNRRTA